VHGLVEIDIPNKKVGKRLENDGTSWKIRENHGKSGNIMENHEANHG